MIRNFSNGFIPAKIPELPRFWSGFTGYFTYEMVSFFEDIPVSLPEDMPYAHFIIPDEMIIFDNMKQTLTCLKICYLDDPCDTETLFDRAGKDLDQMLDTIRRPFERPEPFPVAHVELAPKIRAMEIISQLENTPRRVYGGAAGYISFTGNMDFAITIRTAVMEKDKFTVQAGAGIVYDSDPEKELMECKTKAKSVETALKLALGNHIGGR